MLQRVVRVWSATTGWAQDTPERVGAGIGRAPTAELLPKLATVYPGMGSFTLIDLSLGSHNSVSPWLRVV
jgi:hypothetical protein